MSPRVEPSALEAVQAAIFDMDGLLVDSERYWRAVEIEVLAGHGIDVAPLMGHGLTMGMRVDEVVAFWRTRLGFETPSDTELVEVIVAGVAGAIREGAVLMPGALEALELFESAGVRIGLATGSTAPVVDAVLERFGLAGRFEAICSAEQEHLGKPHPAVYLSAARALGVAAPLCVALEDSLNGVIAAKAARMRVIAVPDARVAGDERYSIADVRLGSLGELDSPEVARVLGLHLGLAAGVVAASPER